jgi:hypothetical protein
MNRTEWNWWGHVAGVGSSDMDITNEMLKEKRTRKDMAAAEAIVHLFGR